jgi:DNA invertase Pin-like site-specific DNA recombinase
VSCAGWPIRTTYSRSTQRRWSDGPGAPRQAPAWVNALEEFRTLGIDFISYRENADTTTAQGKLIFGIMASLAEFERALIAERVKAGMARAKAQGKHVGRPRIPTQTEAAIRRDLLAGRSLRSTIKSHSVGSKTVQRIKAELADESRRSRG